MSRPLATAREAFVAAIRRDTPGSDLPRLVAVLDELIAWSEARKESLSFREEEGRADVFSYQRAGSKVVFWSAQVTRGRGTTLELYPPAGRGLSPEERETVMEMLNAHSREVLVEGDRLRIGFSALKNAAARSAVLELMDELLASSGKAATAAR